MGINQVKLAELLSVRRSAVSKYETGKVPLTDDTIGRLTKIFGVSADYLLGLDSESDVPTPKTEKIPVTHNGHPVSPEHARLIEISQDLTEEEAAIIRRVVEATIRERDR
jgi:plasmid maintenance system antidote protein VapI